MIIGFALNRQGGSKFGVVSAVNKDVAKKAVMTQFQAAADEVVIISAEEALSQFNGLAYLIPAED